MADVKPMNRIAALALCRLTGTATAQERPAAKAGDLRATAAEAARITAIQIRCPAHIGIDVGFTETLQGTILMDGIRRIGKDPFLRIVKAEQARIQAEVAAIGPAAWCRRQKALLEKPYPDVFRP